MKRILSSILVLLMCASLFACAPKATTEPAADATAAQDQAAGTEAQAEDTATTFGLKPFAERQTLRIGFFTGSPLSYPFLFADKMGYFDELNIDVEYVSFTGGPAMIEAYKEWDIASCGEGGLCIAMKKAAEFGLKIVDITDYEENIALFARAGSKLAEDPTNPENWKGTEWVYPTGTTAQAVLVNALAKLGLTLNDIKSTNMDNASSLTGFKRRHGRWPGCWIASHLRGRRGLCSHWRRGHDWLKALRNRRDERIWTRISNWLPTLAFCSTAWLNGAMPATRTWQRQLSGTLKIAKTRYARYT
jgi:ABC-type nitrate/sulfonate/bicarbonate transport system substrate-binding protein